MKLELKHIQHYPIGGDNALKIKCFEDEIHELLGINTYKYDFKNRPSKKKPRVIVGTYRNVGGYMTSMVKLEDIRPILRPMSELYREIDGKIGIVELTKIEHPCSIYHDLKCGYVEVAGDDNGSLRFALALDEDGSFINTCFDCWDVHHPVRFQLDLFNYLFENHYDVYDLIGQGLAIDKNTIQN